jgi:hypothetical protein
LILIYAQPLTRILSLTRDDVNTAGGRVAVHLGAEPLQLPEPLGGRTGAVMTVAAALPATILAELLGISETSASKWYQLAAGANGALRRPAEGTLRGSERTSHARSRPLTSTR